eukprot:GFYU01004542.1.p1 GENE.GFYU01004542.1~~GFYU01004542.1.p1  ORF type:complete len:245 (+),score=20.87 GFYU01004542.1:94-735(+)
MKTLSPLLELTPQDSTFFSGDEEITIIPNFRMSNPLYFVSGTIPEFKPPKPATVPLWLALTLKSRQKCKIIPPAWMTPASLQDKLDEERANPQRFADLPHYYLEIASLMLKHAADDIEEPHAVRTLIEDIEGARSEKLKAGLQSIQNRVAAVNLNNISSMEITKVRSFFSKSLDQFYSLAKDSRDVATRNVSQADTGAAAASGRVLRRFQHSV